MNKLATHSQFIMMSFVSRYMNIYSKAVLSASITSRCMYSTSDDNNSTKKKNDKFDSLFENVLLRGYNDTLQKVENSEEIPEGFEHLFEHLPRVSHDSRLNQTRKTARSIFQSIVIPECNFDATISKGRKGKKSISTRKKSHPIFKDSEQCVWDSFEKEIHDIGDDITILFSDQKTTLGKNMKQNIPIEPQIIESIPPNHPSQKQDNDAYGDYIRLFNDANGQYIENQEIYENSCISALKDLYESSPGQKTKNFINYQRQVIEKQLSIYESLLNNYDLDINPNEKNIKEKTSIFLKSLRLMNYANHPNNIRIMDIFKIEGLLSYIDISRITTNVMDITIYYPIESTLPIRTPLKDWYIEPSVSMHISFIKICQFVGGFKYAWQYYCHYLIPTMSETYKYHLTPQQHYDIIMLLISNRNITSIITSEQCMTLLDLYIKYDGRITHEMILPMMHVHVVNRELNYAERIFDLYIRIPIMERFAFISSDHTINNEFLSIESVMQSTKLLIECYIESFAKYAIYCAHQVYNRMIWLEKVISIASNMYKEKQDVQFLKIPSHLFHTDPLKFIMDSNGFKEYLERFLSIAKQDESTYESVKDYLECIQSLISKQ